MNELQTILGELATCERKDFAKQIMTICRAITPQFYKNMTTEDTRAERISVELLIGGIDGKTLAKMCEMAVKEYALNRSRNEHSYFDINYILKFYERAYNYIHHDSIELSVDAEFVKGWYDEDNHIYHQLWKDKGKELEITSIYIPEFRQGVYVSRIQDLRKFNEVMLKRQNL